MQPFRQRDCCPTTFAIDFGQRSAESYRFRFDRESIRLLAFSPFERWQRTLPANQRFDVEFETSSPGIHVLECPNIRRFAPALLDAVRHPFVRLADNALMVLTLASLHDLAVVRRGDVVAVAFHIDTLQEFYCDQVSRIAGCPEFEPQLQRMLLIGRQLGLADDDWLEPMD